MSELSESKHLVLFNDFPGSIESFTYEEAKRHLTSVFQLLNNEIIDFCFPFKLHRDTHNQMKVYGTNWALRGIFDDSDSNSENQLFRNFVIPLKSIVKIEKEGREKFKFGKFGVKIYFSSGGHLFFPMPAIEGSRTSFIHRVNHLKKNSIQFEEDVWLPDPSWMIRLAEESQFDLVLNEFCQTYPRFFVVPKTIPTSFIKESSRCRSRERFPIISYVSAPSEGADDDKVFLLRSSQPLNKLMKSKTTFEAEYLANVCGYHSLVIIDCRPKKDAVAYQFIGKGYESVKEYEKFISEVEFHFLGIPHAYKIRKFYIDMLKSLFEGESFAFKKWSELAMQILNGSSYVVDHLNNSKSVLVHCSDGWDRTSQIVSLAQVMFDPRYRTIKGFIELVQKDWIDMGHIFGYRCGHVQSDDYGETSPIFAQFIDCVAQLMNKYPTEFEFNLTFLEIILSSAYSQLFGDFMGNNYEDRLKMKRPTSIFLCLLDERYGFSEKIKNSQFSTNERILLMRRDEDYKFLPELLGTPVFFSDKVPLLVGDPPSFPEFSMDEVERIVEDSHQRRKEKEDEIKLFQMEDNKESGYFDNSFHQIGSGNDVANDNNNDNKNDNNETGGDNNINAAIHNDNSNDNKNDNNNS
ncbi:hypothetical protein M9Y10_006537 [Tritrichomonas musculus]|uniref:Myotubularin phosphatase domain-containing protein n=1 Tax=Tritrichomonas musculus TaxID=1915356 RepID=A0ABR2JEM1_9EUKA